MIKSIKAFLDESGTVKARMEDFPSEAFRTVYGDGRDDKKRLVSIARKCLNYRANALTEVPYQFERGKNIILSYDQNEQKRGTEELAALIDLLRPIEISLIRWGTAYIDIDNMRLLPSQQMSIASDKSTGEILYYTRKINNKEIRYEVDQIIFIHETSDEDGKAIEPILTTVSFDIETLFNIDNYIASYFKNGAIKTTLITVEGFPLKEETDRLEDYLTKVATGVKNAFKNIVLRLPITPIVIGSGLEGFDPVLTQNKILDIVTAFEIPPSLVLANAANYATAISDKKEFYSSVVSPRCQLIAKAVNRQWLNDYGISLTFLINKHSVMQVDETIRSQSLVNLINAGFDLITAVEVLGYDLSEEQLQRLKDSMAEKKQESKNDGNDPNSMDNSDSANGNGDSGETDNEVDVIYTKSYSVY